MQKVILVFSQTDADLAQEIYQQVSSRYSNDIFSKFELKSSRELIRALDFDNNDVKLVPILSIDSLKSSDILNELVSSKVKYDIAIYPILRGRVFKRQIQSFWTQVKPELFLSYKNETSKGEITEFFESITSQEADVEELYSKMEAKTSGNPFRRIRSEYYDFQDLARIFAEPESTRYERIIELKPTIIQGGRGCGKSMLLKSMEAVVAAHRHGKVRSFKKLNIDYFGVYCRLTQGSFATLEGNILKHVSQEAAIRLFTNELILQLSQSLLEEIARCAELGVIKADSQTTRKFASEVSLQVCPKKACESIEDLITEIQGQLRSINEYLTRKVMGERPQSPATFLTRNQLREICKSVIRNYSDLAGVTVYFLMDEYENLLDFQKTVLNTLIKWAESKIYSVKIATRKTGFQKTKTTEGVEIEEPADYNLVDLDYNLSVRGSVRNYIRLLRKICNNNLRAEGINVKIDKILAKGSIAPSLTENEIEDEVRKMVEQIRGRIWSRVPQPKRQEYLKRFKIAATYRRLGTKHRQFSGFQDLALLSSGIIRHFLELIGMAYYFATQAGVDVNNGEAIQPEYQTQAAYAISNYYLATIGKNISEHGPVIRQLVFDLGDIFHYKLIRDHTSPESCRISIVDPQRLYSPNFGDAGRIINAALLHSVLQSSPYGLGGERPTSFARAQPEDLILNRVYAPALRYSPRARWPVNMTTRELQGLVDQEGRAKVKTMIIRREGGATYTNGQTLSNYGRQTTLLDVAGAGNDLQGPLEH